MRSDQSGTASNERAFCHDVSVAALCERRNRPLLQVALPD
jgi:hypothetical protein